MLHCLLCVCGHVETEGWLNSNETTDFRFVFYVADADAFSVCGKIRPE